MAARHAWWFPLSVTALVAACGGGAVIAVLGTLGAGGGDWLVDADPQTAGYEPRNDCSGGAQLCRININPGNFFDTDYDVTAGGNYVDAARGIDCEAAPSGTVTDAVNVNVPGCFVGKLLSVNEARSNDGSVHAYFDFSPDMATGVWVDIHDDTRRFVFSSDIEGCEVTGTAKRRVDLEVRLSNFGAFGSGFAVTLIDKTTISSFSIGGDPAYTGTFVGASGLRLVRGSDKIEIQRQRIDDAEQQALLANCN